MLVRLPRCLSRCATESGAAAARLRTNEDASCLDIRVLNSVRSKTTTFECNICGASSTTPLGELRRELASCPACSSSLRFRAVIAALSIGVFGRSLALPDFPRRPDLRGLGMSDWEGYARCLTDRFSYTNTFYHCQPLLDVTKPPPSDLARAHDFLISSDVLEHVRPPLHNALANCQRLLKPGGFMVLTVPFGLAGTTIEHYPHLHRYAITEVHGQQVLINRTVSGEWEVFDDLVFHGGDGSTLEMRVCSLPDLVQGLSAAGFVDIEVWDRETPEHGVVWNEPCSLPIIARAP